ncbi:phage holin family protein [Fructilactobacillus sp. Tb1]|uniref:phage holin family protein n=1 Tax=Fructilactobacillus sp. Tb1 TaxID=3422304 RepID=UPI003D2E1C29
MHTVTFFHLYLTSMDKGFGSFMFQALIAVVIADVLLGTVRGWLLKKVNSTISVNGLAKHVMIIVIPMFLYPYVDIMGYGYFGDAVIAYLAYAQLTSLAENWIAMGLPFDPKWKQYFDEKKIEQKMRTGSIHTDNPVPDEKDKKL